MLASSSHSIRPTSLSNSNNSSIRNSSSSTKVTRSIRNTARSTPLRLRASGIPRTLACRPWTNPLDTSMRLVQVPAQCLLQPRRPMPPPRAHPTATRNKCNNRHPQSTTWAHPEETASPHGHTPACRRCTASLSKRRAPPICSSSSSTTCRCQLRHLVLTHHIYHISRGSLTAFLHLLSHASRLRSDRLNSNNINSSSISSMRTISPLRRLQAIRHLDIACSLITPHIRMPSSRRMLLRLVRAKDSPCRNLLCPMYSRAADRPSGALST